MPPNPPGILTRVRQSAARQRSSHSRLLQPLPPAPTSSRTTRLDAIVVPASRRAHRLRHVLDLAVRTGTRLVVLASHDCQVDEVSALIARTPGSRALLVRIPGGYRHDLLHLETSDPSFRALNSGRDSNLSMKRNLGLVLARLRGWHKIMFMDDDLLPFSAESVHRIAHHLEDRRFAGLRTTSFEDNSVVCHANRLAGSRQGIFVSGAALGVNCADLPLDVFPDIYNEDWFAFAREAERADVGCAGEARQLQFNPFEDPQRAAREEFGDVLAEGLYALFSQGDGLGRATRGYWERFIASRASLITGIEQRLASIDTHESVQAQASLDVAKQQLASVSSSDCLRFIDAWQADRRRFAEDTARLRVVPSNHQAFDLLGLTEWQVAEFGTAEVPTRFLPMATAQPSRLGAGGKRNRSSTRSPALSNA